jgi:folate-binding Fe-S cluster repair protein YgfZ
MSPVLNDASPSLLEWSVLEARGADAATFLQGQLSQDLRSLDDEGAWTLILAPDSVVVTTGFITAAADGFDVFLPRELAEAAHARLRRFLLRVACTLTLRESDRGPFMTLDEQIDANWPGPGEFAAALTPHTFGRNFVAATISFDKGCFTGQELVGRLDARGSSVPWRLVRVSGPSAAAIDEVLTSKGPAGPQGLTSSRMREGRVEGLGIAHRTLLSSPSGDATVSVDAVE